MGRIKTVNWSAVIQTVGFAFLGFVGHELYSEVKNTHDAIIQIKAAMVPRTEFDMQIADLKTRVASIEVEIQNLKQRAK
jgi:prefoldin subunit 5